ncbi:MAG TPA: winged helix-turn-helix domain-containing protein [Terriglobales bacterium]|nr:winged helix-turn-helix domain-containing protein [Terriglobales bacterium]
METPSKPPVIQFGAFEVDSRAGELRKNGYKVRIQQQPFAVLMALLERPGEVVTREELRDRLWPNDTFVDFEHGLNAAVKRLRDALGESAERPVFIETLAKRGYRFIGSINGHHLAPIPPPVLPVSVPATSKRPYAVRLTIVVFVVLAIAIGVTLFLRNRPQPTADHIETRLTENSPENPVTGAAISPDGNYLAYSDTTGLYLKLIRTGETHALNLPTDFYATPVSWFPDGAHLLVNGGEKREADGLWSLSIYGGQPRKVIDSALTGFVSPDGQRIAVLRGSPDWGVYGSEIWTYNADGTNPVRSVPGVANSAIGGLAWSPDGRRIAYTLTRWYGHSSDTSTIEIAGPDGSGAHTLLRNRNIGPAIEWLPDGRLIYALREERPNQRDSNAWAMQVNKDSNISGNSVRLTRSFGWISGISSSSDGKHLAFLKDAWGGHVFLGQLSPDENHVVNIRRITLEESKDLPTAWTADSKAILFSSDRNGHSEIFKQAIDQTQAELLVSSAANLLLPRLSPDGSEVLYISVPQDASAATPGTVYAAPVNGGVSRKILEINGLGMGNVECARAPANFCVIHFIDGEHVTFFRFDPKTGAKSELTSIDNQDELNWGLSPDGAYLAILPYSPENGSVTLYSVSDGKMKTLDVKGWTGLNKVDWAADSKSMFIGTLNRAGHIALLRVTLDGGVHVLREGNFPSLCGCAFWAIPSPDGKRVALNQPTGASNVWGLDTK